MKKFALIALSLLLVCTLAFSVSAKENAFEDIVVREDTEFIDDEADQGTNGVPIGYYEGHGVGCSWIGDYVVFRDVDFGENGAKQFMIFWAMGDDRNEGGTNLQVYIDNQNGTPAADFTAPQTSGWDMNNAEWVTVDCAVEGGVHDVFVKFVDGTGSFDRIKFVEADPAPVVDDQPSEETPAGDTSAAQTFDVLLLASAACVASAGAVIVSKKRH